MTERQMRNRAKKYMDLQNQIKALQEEQEALKAELKAELTALGVESAEAGNFTVHFQTVPNNRFDTKTFKAEHSALYEKYFKTGTTKKFWVA